MRTGPVTFAKDGEVNVEAEPAVEEEAAACPEVLQPYDISEETKQLDAALPDSVGFSLFQKFAEVQLLNSHIFHHNGAKNLIQVENVEATDPMVWLARARVAVSPGALVLVPWVASLARLVPEEGNDSDGIVEKSIKRPRHLHGSLPLFAKIRISCKQLGDNVDFAARSPLAGKLSSAAACPSAFWCVLEAGEGDDERVNMKLETGHMSFPATQAKISGTPACRKKKSHQIDIEIPVLVNSRPIKKGQVLIMDRGIKLEVGEHLDGGNTEQQACGRHTYVRTYVLTSRVYVLTSRVYSLQGFTYSLQGFTHFKIADRHLVYVLTSRVYSLQGLDTRSQTYVHTCIRTYVRTYVQNSERIVFSWLVFARCEKIVDRHLVYSLQGFTHFKGWAHGHRSTYLHTYVRTYVHMRQEPATKKARAAEE